MDGEYMRNGPLPSTVAAATHGAASHDPERHRRVRGVWPHQGRLRRGQVIEEYQSVGAVTAAQTARYGVSGDAAPNAVATEADPLRPAPLQVARRPRPHAGSRLAL